ncbi:MAG: ATP-binding protein, partial [Paraburkholderia sp.]|nr:ATP-binding protein [Paraburkholderia sp.]
MRSWGLPGSGGQASSLVDDAVLLTSELVTNAVVHAGTQVSLTCRLGGNAAGRAVEVTVRDRHPARSLTAGPQPGDPGDAGDPLDPAGLTSGRGLMLPSALATAWGVSYARTAKAVWFRIGLDDYPADAPRASDAPVAGALSLGDREERPGVGGEAASPAGEPGVIEAGPAAGRLDLGKLGYDELLRHTVELARDAVDADAAYALVADEDGELR